MRSNNTWLLAGLGNPGDKYSRNWHNCGYMVLDILAQRHNIKIRRIRFRSLTGQGRIDQAQCLLLKPSTYMNLSGEAVRSAMAWTGIDAGHCLVIYDDIDLPAGQIRIRNSGGPGTHNGMRSIVEKIGCETFPRLRIGIGPLPGGRDIADYVLSDIPTSDRERIWQVLNYAADAVELLVNRGIGLAMSRFNGQYDLRQDNDQ